MRPVVLCSLRARDAAKAVKRLKASGIAECNISVLAPDLESHLEGGSTAGFAEELAGATRLMVSGIGPFVITGPIARMLVGQPGGRLVAGLTAAAADLPRLVGLCGDAAPRLEQQLRTGSCVVFAHHDDEGDRASATQVFERLGASEIHTAGRPTRRGNARRAASPASRESW